ncbi:MAG: hypothetical protein IPL98_18930 [Saprospiraceae bacterium]|nr:hypothetical protein [Saprospiraceae bacterium]
MVKVRTKQIKFPFHQYGYIELKPIDRHLKETLALSLEFMLEPSHNAKHDKIIDPKPENDIFCKLWQGKCEIISIQRGENRFHYSCTCNETDCEP